MSVNQNIKPEIVKGARVVVSDAGRVVGSFIEVKPSLIGNTGIVEAVDRGYTIYQPEAYVRMEDGSLEVIELPHLEVTTEKPKTPAQAERAARVKYLYSVEDNGVSVYTTFDREEAREEKAFLGGKAEGVIITAYAPVKEIR